MKGACVLTVLMAAASHVPAGEHTVPRCPNLILIMADDLGAKELSCYGHPRHRTPNLDRLARTGIQFRTCYTACICHPTRFEIMTGQYGCTNGVYQFAGRPGGPEPNAPEEQIVNHLTFGQVLQSAGYATAMAGKWQLSGKVPDLVVECGFDEYCMWAYKHNLPTGVRSHRRLGRSPRWKDVTLLASVDSAKREISFLQRSTITDPICLPNS